MKKKILCMLVLMMFTATTMALAGGGQVRGDKGAGPVVRTQTTGNGK